MQRLVLVSCLALLCCSSHVGAVEEKHKKHHHHKHQVELVVASKAGAAPIAAAQAKAEPKSSDGQKQITDKMHSLEKELAKKEEAVKGVVQKGRIEVNGPLPADFSERFAQAVSKATGSNNSEVCGVETNPVEGTAHKFEATEAKQLHPDVAGPDAEEAFKRLQEASGGQEKNLDKVQEALIEENAVDYDIYFNKCKRCTKKMCTEESKEKEGKRSKKKDKQDENCEQKVKTGACHASCSEEVCKECTVKTCMEAKKDGKKACEKTAKTGPCHESCPTVKCTKCTKPVVKEWMKANKSAQIAKECEDKVRETKDQECRCVCCNPLDRECDECDSQCCSIVSAGLLGSFEDGKVFLQQNEQWQDNFLAYQLKKKTPNPRSATPCAIKEGASGEHYYTKEAWKNFAVEFEGVSVLVHIYECHQYGSEENRREIRQMQDLQNQKEERRTRSRVAVEQAAGKARSDAEHAARWANSVPAHIHRFDGSSW